MTEKQTHLDNMPEPGELIAIGDLAEFISRETPKSGFSLVKIDGKQLWIRNDQIIRVTKLDGGHSSAG